MTAAAPTDCESLLATLIAINSVNPRFGGPANGVETMFAALEAWAGHSGLKSRRLPAGAGRDNLLVYWDQEGERPWLLLDSHVDTVGVERMEVAPFSLHSEGDRLFGRGTCDTKGSGAAMLVALRDYARGASRPCNAGVLFTFDEEAGMTGASAFAHSQLPEFLPRLRGIIVGEPTSMRPVVATNGVVRWRTITRGVAAHSSDPAKGRSAISQMLRVVSALESEYVATAGKTHPLTGRAAASVNVITGGSQINIIPDFCAIECDRRLIPGETADQALADRDQALRGSGPVEHDQLYIVPPLPESSSATCFAWAKPVLERAGFSHEGRGAAFVTNGSLYGAAGAQIIVLGPGDAAQAHTKDEWVSREQLALACRTYETLLRECV